MEKAKSKDSKKQSSTKETEDLKQNMPKIEEALDNFENNK